RTPPRRRLRAASSFPPSVPKHAMNRILLSSTLGIALATTLAACAALDRSTAAPDAAPASAITISVAPDDWAALHGRLVRIDAPLVISGNHRLERDGSVVLAFGDRLRAPTEVARPGADAAAVA